MMFMQNLMGIEATLEFYAAYQMYERPMDFWDRLFIGIGAIVAGIGAILLGVSSLGCTVPGGIALIALGGVTILGGGLALAFAVNDIVYYNTGYNAFRVKFGWDQTTYEKIEKGVMITAVVLTLICEIATGAVRARQCFIAGTLVLCQDEKGEEIQKPIEEIEVGDLVWAYDEETGESDWKPVVRLFRNTTKEWYHIKVNEEEIICTGEHPFYVEGRGFVFAKNLKINDKLLQNSGEYATIKEIKIQKLVKDEKTYNFEVADFHTYYVSNLNILVHNTCKEVQKIFKEFGVDNFDDLAAKYTPDEMIKKLDGMGYSKSISMKNPNRPAIIMSSANGKLTFRIQTINPQGGTAYFRVFNAGGGALNSLGVFPSWALKQQMRLLTHFYFGG